MSPTISSAAASGTALSSDCISKTSTMETSSTTSRSHSSGVSSLRLKPKVFGSNSSRRWMVRASRPVASVMRRAARPVGAQSRSRTPLADRMRRIALTRVVLPTPGPPVTTRTLERSASRSASAWLAARVSPVRPSIQGSALSASIAGQGNVPDNNRRNLSATPLSA